MEATSEAPAEKLNVLNGTASIKDEEQNGSENPVLQKTTASGIVLVPQPSDDPEEPLNWSFVKKHLALTFLIIETFLAKGTATFIAPGAHTLAHDFHTTATKGTYLAAATTIVSGLAPLVWIPLSQRIGRRPVLLLGSLLALCFNIGLAKSQTYAQALTCRIFGYAASSAGLCITPAAISDMFFLHEKGTRMGFNAFLLVTAPYVGGVVGGSIQYSLNPGWRWSMNIAAILYAFLFVGLLLFVPEILYDREVAANEPPEAKRTIWRRLGFRAPHPKESWAATFKRPYPMFAYPAVLLPSFWFSLCYMTEIANTAGFPLNFGPGSRYNFNTQQIGFCSFSGLIGAVLAEWTAGPVCDLIARRNLKRGKAWRPERLLKLTWSALITIPAGLLLYGLELNYPRGGWAAALAGIVIFVFGQEVLVTVLMTYMTDAYPEQASEVAIVFQVCLNVMAYHPPFYFPLWIEKSTAKVPYIVYAVLPVVFFPVCIGMLMWKGPEIRAKGPWGGKKGT